MQLWFSWCIKVFYFCPTLEPTVIFSLCRFFGLNIPLHVRCPPWCHISPRPICHRWQQYLSQDCHWTTKLYTPLTSSIFTTPPHRRLTKLLPVFYLCTTNRPDLTIQFLFNLTVCLQTFNTPSFIQGQNLKEINEIGTCILISSDIHSLLIKAQ